MSGHVSNLGSSLGPVLAPRIPKSGKEKLEWNRVVVVLENATLETVKVGSKFQLLNTDDHIHILKKSGRDPAEPRPDILHQCLLTLLDSPLNKAGKLQVFIHTRDNVLIEVNPHTRIPRTFKRFSALMVQLLHKLSIRAANGPEKLLKVIKNPITDHLPPGARRIELSETGTLVKVDEFAAKTQTPREQSVVFIVGAFSHGSLDVDYKDECISVSQYPLSGAYAAARLVNAYEKAWGIV